MLMLRYLLLTVLLAACAVANQPSIDAGVTARQRLSASHSSVHRLSFTLTDASCAQSGSISVLSCPGVVGDGVTDDWAAIQSCINTHPNIRIFFPKTSPPLPPGQVEPNIDYRLSQTLYACGPDQTLDGITGFGSGGTVLWWSSIDADGGATAPYTSTGIALAPNPTQPCDPSAPCSCEWTQSPTGARIESINLRAGATAYADNAAGILISAVGVVLDHVSVQGFAGDGIDIESNTSGANASDFHISSVTSTYNFGSGMHTAGANSEIGVFSACISQSNHKWGFLEDSTFGNVYISPQTRGNLLGGFHALNVEGSSQFIGGYAELDQPLSQVGSHNIMFGGNVGVDQTLHPAVISGTLAGSTSGLAQTQTVFVQPAGTPDAGSALSPVTLLTGGWGDPSGVFSATTSGIPSSGYVELRRAVADPANPTAPASWWGITTYTAIHSPLYYSILFSDSTTSVGQGAVWIPRGLFLGGANPAADVRRLIVNAQSVPTGNNPWGKPWGLGDIVLNSLSTPGQPIGWTYTGSAWTAFGMAGVLSASQSWAAHAPDGSYMATTTVSVTGATPGDTVSCGYSSLAKDGYLLSGSVTAAGVVSVTLLDLSAQGWTLPSGTLRVDVVHHQ